MIDPSKLQAGATAVYGEEAFQRDFGDLQPVPEERTIAASDLQTFELGGRSAPVPGHPGACQPPRLHIRPPERLPVYTATPSASGTPQFRRDGRPLVVATTTPVAFDPDAWFDSLDT